MRVAKPIRSNLLFLLVEVRAQLKVLCALMVEGEADVAARIVGRRGFTYNLNLHIQEGCAARMARDEASMTLRAVASIAANLLRLNELACDCVQQLADLPDDQRPELPSYPPMLQNVRKSLNLIEQALPGNNAAMAIKLGAAGHRLALECRQLAAHHGDRPAQKRRAPADLGGLLIARTISQMGDVLLNISGAMLSSSLGQPMELSRFQALQGTLSAVDAHHDGEFTISPAADSRSGGSIAAIHYQNSEDDETMAVFKDGEHRKLKAELRGIKRWQRAAPGLAPEILNYQRQGDSAAILIEHLQGITFEKIVLQAPPKLRADAMSALTETLSSVWSSTRKKGASSVHFVQQTQKRLADIYAVHPDFYDQCTTVCGVAIESFAELLHRADALERTLPAPFTVLAHGDFNIDNILFDSQHNKINFIDLHRAAAMDIAQDVSVFMVSNYRLQVFAAPVRRRIRKQVVDLCTFARKFSQKHGDRDFELRLALGLARSFATSTRFILDRAVAQRMFLRARYLLEQVLQAANTGGGKHYQISIKELFHD